MTTRHAAVRLALALAALAPLAGCGGPGDAPRGPAGAKNATLVLGAYTTPREAYAKILPLFAEQQRRAGREVIFQQSYLGSGAQSRAIVEGFEADIAALSLDPDVERIAKAGLITGDWRRGPSRGMVTRSVVAFAVRRGNPKNIRDWADLARPGLDVLTPNPRTSGGAMWNILALVGAARRGQVEGVAKGDAAAVEDLLRRVLANVHVMDKGARESITTFEKGVGDVAITYEHEVLVAQAGGREIDLVLPRSTILIENPLAVVDRNADKHGTRELAEAFARFLLEEEAQRAFAETGFRPVHAGVERETAARFPVVPGLFTIEDFGGWTKAQEEIFGETGLYPRALSAVQK